MQLEVYERALNQWLKEHPDKTGADITSNIAVSLEGLGQIRLGNKINRVRKIYSLMQEGNHLGKYKDLTEEEFNFWNSYHIFDKKEKRRPTVGKRKKRKDEKYRQALEKWLKEHPGMTGSDIPQWATVEVEKVGLVHLGTKVSRLQCIYNAMQRGKTYSSYSPLTEEEISYWKSFGCLVDEGQTRGSRPTDADYRMALLKWLEEHPGKTGVDIYFEETQKLDNGKIIKLGNKINRLRSVYHAMQRGEHYCNYRDLTSEELAFWGKYHCFDPKKEASVSQKNSFSHTDYQELSLKEKWRLFYQNRQTSKDTNVWSIPEILEQFQIDTQTFLWVLEKSKKNDLPVHPLSKCGKFKQYCDKNGYDYKLITRALSLSNFLKKESFDQLMDRSISFYNDKKENDSWVYDYYGNHIEKVLTFLELPTEKILKNVSKRVVSIEDFLADYIFDMSCGNFEKDLRKFYHYILSGVNLNQPKDKLIDEVSEVYQELVSESPLTLEERTKVKDIFLKYIVTVKEFHILDVGMTENKERQLEKVLTYGFDNADIEDSFFVKWDYQEDISFDQLTRQELLKECVLNWNFYQESDKEKIAFENNLTEEELSFITNSRQEMNTLFSKVKRNRELESDKIKKLIWHSK